MSKFIALVQVLISLVAALAAAATLVNLIFISTRPETISVVNTLIGQGVLIICLLVMARVLLKRGLAGLRQPKTAANADTAT